MVGTEVSQRTHSFLSNAPVIVAVAGGVAVTFVVSRASHWDIDVGAIFSGVFDITTILTGFLATFYVFVVARQNRFLENIQHTESFRSAVGLLRFNIYWACSVIVLSWGCMIVKPVAIVDFTWEQALVLAWAINCILLTFNFVRSVYHFNVIISARERS